MLFCCDKASAVKDLPFFDFIVSNPPYISKGEYASLEKSVIDFEPRLALYGGKDGLDFYRYLAGSAQGYLKNKGRIYCEIGYNQKESVSELFRSAGWGGISVVNDLAQRPRVLMARWE
jgi:release factor glutamine methyltransferase